MILFAITCLGVVGAAVGGVMWNKERVSLWRMSVTVFGMLYEVFAALFFARMEGLLPLRNDVENDPLGLNMAMEMMTRTGWMSTETAETLIEVTIAAVSIGVACIALMTGAGKFRSARLTLTKGIVACVVALTSIPILFPLCCIIMMAGGYACNMTYKVFCVIGNNYAQAAMLVWSAICVAICMVRYRLTLEPKNIRRWGMALVTLVYAGCYVGAFWFMCRHYDMPMDDAYTLTVKELTAAGAWTGLGYAGVSLVIYVFGFAGIIALNCGLAYSIKKRDFTQTAMPRKSLRP